MTRPILLSDISKLKIVLDNCDLFPSEYLDPMIAPYLNGNEKNHYWFTYELEEDLVAIAYCAPMQLTDRTYNLYAIGIHNDFQRKGIGTELITHIENILLRDNQRILIVETSSSDNQSGARKFYTKLGYTNEAKIRDFWEEGDDKIVFWKKLNE